NRAGKDVAGRGARAADRVMAASPSPVGDGCDFASGCSAHEARERVGDSRLTPRLLSAPRISHASDKARTTRRSQTGEETAMNETELCSSTEAVRAGRTPRCR